MLAHSIVCAAALLSSHVRRRRAYSNSYHEHCLQKEHAFVHVGAKNGHGGRNDKFGSRERANAWRIDSLLEHSLVGAVTNIRQHVFALEVPRRGISYR